ncbi:MAG TPA: protein kinase [Gammaproteobacteria bacterium]|nr:protein kinase [Gammaproteobacteria bacterium]
MSIEIDEITLLLSGVEILQDLDVDVIDDIARQCRVTEFKQGETVIRSGTLGERIYFICDGKAEVQIPDTTGAIKRRIQIDKGDVVGEISLLVKSTYSADIIALTDTSAFYLDRPRFRALIEKHSEFAEVMSHLMTSRMAQSGGINQVGKYELRGKLGEGNMATVFNAWDPELEREVAIKMLKYRLAYNEDFLDRFEREARTIASLNHPNIINVFEIIDAYSTRFIVMEKLHGRDLAACLVEDGAFDLAKTRDILYQVAGALHYAHNHGEKGIVHRDIKPSNIAIDDYGNIKLTDFGIASPPKDRETDVLGTPSYLAPEIIRGDVFDGRADIYAMGVMAFHMLAGSPPFNAVTLAEMLRKQVEQKPPNIRSACPAIDNEFAGFIDSALRKEPGQRISDWVKIREILKTPNRLNLMLDPGELAVVIRFRDTHNQQSVKFITAMQKLLRDENINHEFEMHRGENA